MEDEIHLKEGGEINIHNNSHNSKSSLTVVGTYDLKDMPEFLSDIKVTQTALDFEKLYHMEICEVLIKEVIA
jgi:hypothetical protein